MGLSVDWSTARRVAAKVGTTPDTDRAALEQLSTDMVRLTRQAEELVAEETGLVSLAGPARGRVTDRAGWVDANLASFDRLTRPLLDKFNAIEEPEPSRLGAAFSKAFDPITSSVAPNWPVPRWAHCSDGCPAVSSASTTS